MKPLTLESVAESFQKWRNKRSTRTEQIPDELWQQALALYRQNKRSIICQHLRLSSSQFNQRLANQNAGSTDSGFVLASSETARDVPVSNEGIDVSFRYRRVN